MAVTKQTYTVNPTWTASQLANIFRSAFIDAGLMLDWHDSFLSGGIENRILRIVYDNTKTYGTTFYWFMFNTTGAFVSVTSGWDTTGKVPSGTLYLDHHIATTNATTNFHQILNVSNTTKVDLFSYQSLVSPGVTWFLMRQGSSSAAFMIFPSTSQIVPWIDLNRTLFHHFVTPNPHIGSSGGGLSFGSRCGIRRSFLLGTALIGSTNLSQSIALGVATYNCSGKLSGSGTNNLGGLFAGGGSLPSSFGFVLPMGANSVNPAYPTDSNPVFNGMPISLYVNNCTVPSDFAIIPHYANNTMEVQDKFVVSAGVEEWEIITVANNGTANTGVSIAFAARIVG